VKKALLYITILIIICISKRLSEDDIIKISINETGLDEGALAFFPGLSNNLNVVPDWDLISASELELNLVKVLPDGSSKEYEVTILRGNNTEIPLGSMTSPPEFEFVSGDVYQSGYQIDISIKERGSSVNLYQISLSQGLSNKASTISATTFSSMQSGEGRLVANQNRKILFNPMYGIEASLGLKLQKNVLKDKDDLRIEYRLTPGSPAEKLPCRLQVRSVRGLLLIDKEIALSRSEGWQTELVNPENWESGKYYVSLYPQIEGNLWEEGSAIVYHRRDNNNNSIFVSPLAPWTIEKDNFRKKVVLTNFSSAVSDRVMPDGWEFAASDEGISVYNESGAIAKPLELNLTLNGYYAVFVQPYSEDGCIIQVTGKGLVRVVSGDRGHSPERDPVSVSDDLIFIEAADLGQNNIKLFGYSRDTEVSKPKVSGKKKLVLIPVTSGSVELFYQQLSNPPVRLNGVNDWADYFHTGNGCVRLKADQFQTIFGAQAELGLNLDWAVGRSWVEYNSDLPYASRFPAIPYEEALKSDSGVKRYHPRIIMINKFDPLDEVLANKDRFHKEVTPWLGMNRHYGTTAYGGMFSSKWFKENQQWWQWQKNADSPRSSAVSFFFPEVRKERTDIFLEVAGRNVDGLLIGTCRQVPMLLFHPEMVAAYKEKSGVNPLDIDGSHPGYKDWITWRADFFTEVLRELKKGLAKMKSSSDKDLIVAVRVPLFGLDWNLAQGLDIGQWLKEGLVDRLQLVPLEERGGEGPRSHNVEPYLLLGTRYNVAIFGGIGSTWSWGQGPGIPSSLRRAIGLINAGVDGIEIYESNDHAISQHMRWIMPLFGSREEAVSFLESSNLEAVYPISASTVMFGYDNHSRWSTSGWNIYGMKGSKL